MATYGARNAKWAPFAAEKADTDPLKLPKYSDVKPFGELNKVTDNLNFVEGNLHGDDAIALYRKRFKDGTLDAESVFIPLSDAALMLGAKTDGKDGLAHSDDDDPPYIGFGFVTQHIGRGKHYWQVVFFPKIKATVPGSETYETSGENVNFATDKMQFHIESPLCRDYKIKKDFATEAEAVEYRDGLFAGTATPPGRDDTAPASTN